MRLILGTVVGLLVLLPAIASAADYELLYDGAGEQRRPICRGTDAAEELARAIHFQMSVLERSWLKALEEVEFRMADNSGDIDCLTFSNSLTFRQPAEIIDIVVTDGLDEWPSRAASNANVGAMYMVRTRTVTATESGVTVGPEVPLYAFVSEFFVRKK